LVTVHQIIFHERLRYNFPNDILMWEANSITVTTQAYSTSDYNVS